MNSSKQTQLLAPQDIREVTKKSFDVNLEALRGVAAILVVWGHTTITNGPLDTYYPTGILSYVGPAHLSVLVFFLLSGYVIGLAHAAPLTRATILNFLKKRFVRIYPIYLLCLLLALVVAHQRYPSITIVNHLTFTQGLFSPFIQPISPSWSLVYEVIFYLLFIPISAFRISPIPIALLAMLVGVIDAWLYPRYGTAVLPSYAFGFVFWLSGLALAKYLPKQPTRYSYAYMASMLFLFMAIGVLDAPITLFHHISIKLFNKDISLLLNDQPGVISFRDFGYLPYCVVILTVFVSKEFRYRNLFIGVLLALPLATLYYYYQHFDEGVLPKLILPVVFYALSIILFLLSKSLEQLSKRLIKPLVVTGSVSYGLYIIHYPILMAFHQIQYFSGSSLTYAIRLLVFLMLCFGSAYLLEKKFQPWIKSKLF